jgi:hypothetical protein
MGVFGTRGPNGAGGSGELRVARSPLWLRALPVVLLAVLIAAQAFTPGDVELGAYYAAVPPLAALTYGVAGTAVLSGTVLVVMQLPLIGAGSLAGSDTGAVALIGALSVVISWVRSRHVGRLVRVSTVAEAAQLAVLAPLPASVGPVHCAALYRAAQRGTLVGGDLYDVRPCPYGVRALVADVQGHGLAAVGSVAALLGAFREAVLDLPDLGEVAGRLERRLSLDSAGNGDIELFATALLLEFPPGRDEVRVVCCGHPPALLVRDGRAREICGEPAPPLGMGLPGLAGPVAVTEPLLPGDLVLAYTDGVTEARDASGAFYPLADRLVARLKDGTPAAPEAVVDAVWEDLAAYAGAVADDVALLALAPR